MACAGQLRRPCSACRGGRSGMHLSSARRRPGGRMTTPCRPSEAWHAPVHGPLEFHGTPRMRAPTARNPASRRISAGQRHVLGRAERAVCKTVGSAYVGSNPTPATSFRRSEPVTRDCVTGFYVQSKRFRRPLALVCGPCVGQIRESAAARGIRV